MPTRLMIAALACTLAATSAAAQDFPRRVIKIISPNPPGGANDTIGRIMAAKLTERLGQQVIIENKGGAGGTIGAALVAQSPPDGYTLLLASVSTHSFAPLTTPKLSYDPIKDFAPVSNFAIVQNVLVAAPSLPVSDVKALIAHAKANPGKLNYSSGGVGSTSHFAVAMFVATAGMARETVHIPHKGGAPALAAIMSGDAHFYFGPIPGMGPHIRSGKVKALGVSGPKRASSLPEVPTVAEAGLPAYQSSGWFGLVAPARTPPAIVALLSRAVADAVKSEEVVRGFAAEGIEPDSNTPETFAAFIKAEAERYARMAKEHDLKFE